MRILRIDLKNGLIKEEKITSDFSSYLMGARGLTSKIIHDEVPPKCYPLGKKNKLIIASGLLTGSSFPCSARASIGAKSPLTNGIKEANVGGRFSMMLALHQVRALILENKSPLSKFVLIDDNGIKLESAEGFKGLGNYALHSNLYKKYGNNIGILSIGPAGEFMMRAASIAANDLEGFPSRHAARGGLGAVMGSKKIKAIIVIPSKTPKISYFDIKKFKEIAKKFTKTLIETKKVFSIYGTPSLTKPMSILGGLPTQNFRKGSFQDVDEISGEKLHEMILLRKGKNQLPCSPTCVIRCSNYIVDENGNHVTSSLEYETIALNGANLMINDLDKLAQIDHYSDDVGIDTIEFGGTIGVAMDCNKIEWGDAKKVIEILDEEIRNNTERGNLFGNGVKHIGELLNATRIPHVKGQGISGYDPRVFKAMSITYATSPMGADHTAGPAVAGRKARINYEYGDLTENSRKSNLSFELQIYISILDSMGCCYFIGPSYENLMIIASALNAMYGTNLDQDGLFKLGKNIIKLELKFNENAGITSKMNCLPDFFYKEPSLPTNLKITYPKEKFIQFWKKKNKLNIRQFLFLRIFYFILFFYNIHLFLYFRKGFFCHF